MKIIRQFEFKEVGCNEIISIANELTKEPEITLATLERYNPPFGPAVDSGLPLRTTL